MATVQSVHLLITSYLPRRVQLVAAKTTDIKTMYVSRLVSLASWSSSFSPHVSLVFRAPCRTITTGKDLIKFGNVGGKTKKDSTRDLDIFLGRWVQQTIQQTEPNGRTVDSKMPITFEGRNYKPYLTYARTDGTWKVEMGFVKMSRDVFYKFKLGRPFVFIYPDNTVSRIIVYQNDDEMKWAFQPLSLDTGLPLREEDVVHQLLKVENDKLIVKTEYPDNIVITKTYIRGDSGDL